MVWRGKYICVGISDGAMNWNCDDHEQSYDILTYYIHHEMVWWRKYVLEVRIEILMITNKVMMYYIYILWNVLATMTELGIEI